MVHPPAPLGQSALEQLLDHAIGHHQNGQLIAAERYYRHILNSKSNHATARHLFGLLRFQQGRHREALDLIAAALRAKPDYPEALYNKGNILSQLERYDEAIANYDQALAIQPSYAEAHHNRGNALLVLKRHDEALASFDRALAVRPDYAEAHDGRGNTLLKLKRFEEALASFDRALTIAPGNVASLNNRGNALSELRRFQEALASFDKALAIKLDDVELLSNRANALAKLGRHEEALAVYETVLTIRPDDAEVHSGKIFALDFLPGTGFAECQEARRSWYQAHAKRFSGLVLPYENSPDPSRRLVLGYVSGDFREHSAAAVFGPILRRHDRASFQLVCYSGATVEDELTREFQKLADKWCPTQALSDEDLAAQIRADKVDILVDLSGHTAGSRLQVFARKPAPVQVTAWGGATGTGLPTIDYLFSDPVAVPETVRPLFAEAIYDLPCMQTFEAPSYAPAVSELPARSCGVVTFGCLNRFVKVSPAALELWARVLRLVPGSRLLLKDTSLDDPSLQAFARDTLAAHGIEADRIDLRGGTSRQDHLAAFNDVDIALDPFPQNGGVSTWEALWAGVPVVTKMGDSLQSRVSGAILSAVGLTDWVANNDEEYARLAVDKASNIEALARLRSELRSAIWASPAGNPDLYTHAVERAYRAMWRKWCASDEAHS